MKIRYKQRFNRYVFISFLILSILLTISSAFEAHNTNYSAEPIIVSIGMLSLSLLFLLHSKNTNEIEINSEELHLRYFSSNNCLLDIKLKRADATEDVVIKKYEIDRIIINKIPATLRHSTLFIKDNNICISKLYWKLR